MDANLGAVLGVFMRWLHVISVVALVGGFIYARFIVAPALESLPAGELAALSNRMVARFRPLLYTVIGTVLFSGLYNYLTKPFYPPHYHMVIGVKFLFVLHVFAASVLYTMPDTAEGVRLRRLTGLVISGLIIVLISADLRWMTLTAPQ